MSALTFEDAIGELVRQFLSANPEDSEVAMRRFRGLTAATGKAAPSEQSFLDELEWFDNFPV